MATVGHSGSANCSPSLFHSANVMMAQRGPFLMSHLLNNLAVLKRKNYWKITSKGRNILYHEDILECVASYGFSRF
jgi:hypothetical protein